MSRHGADIIPHFGYPECGFLSLAVPRPAWRPRLDTYKTEYRQAGAQRSFEKRRGWGLCEAHPFFKKGVSGGCSAYRNHAGMGQPPQKEMVPELQEISLPQYCSLVSWADSTQDKQDAMRRTQSVPLRRRPEDLCLADLQQQSRRRIAERATDGDSSEDHDGWQRPVSPALLCPPKI